MLIYNIFQEAYSPWINNCDIEMIPVKMKVYNPNKDIKLDTDFMFNKYGFYLSKYECDQFVTHYQIWEAFKKSPDPFCMIIEDTAQLRSPVKENLNKLQSLLTDNQNWDVFFPFEKSFPKDIREVKQGYLLGCYWGLDAYFISRKAIDKLLALKVIKQPLDEEILYRSVANELEIYCQETNCFEFHENIRHKKTRQQTIKEAIFECNAWSRTNKRKVQTLLQIVSQIACQNGIDLILCDGTLLGQIRHGGIMPWDDDVDLALNKNESDRLIGLIKNNTKLKSSVFYWGQKRTPYYKIWDDDGQSIADYSYKFPFIDVWLFSENGEQIIFDTGTLYPKKIYFPFSDVIFEGSAFKLPKAPLDCLDKIYSNWRTNIQVFPWSHQTERNNFTPLSIEILVDHNGRIIL